MAYNEYLTYKEQVTYDGINWVDTGVVVPSGDSIGTYDTLAECELGTKVRIGYGTRYGYVDAYKSKACDGDSVLHRSEVTIPDGTYGALYIGDCVETIESSLTATFDYHDIDFYRIDGGSNVETIGKHAFEGQTELFVWDLYVKMPNLKRIEEYAFSGINGQGNSTPVVAGFTLPDGLEYIGDYAFNGGRHSTQGGYFVIPASVTFIGDKAIATNVEYNGFEFKGTVPPAISGNPWPDTGYNSPSLSTKLIYVPANRSVIQAYIDAIHGYDYYWTPIQPTPNGPVFSTLDCKLGISRGGQFKYLWYAGTGSDTGVLNSTDIRCLDGNCNQIYNGVTDVIVGNMCSTISANTFAGYVTVTNAIIADTVTSIGMYAFYGCSGLTSITVLATTPPTLSQGTFDNTNDCPIFVPCESIEAYRTAWSTYASRIQCTQDTRYRWVNLNPLTDYYCDGTTKMYKQKKQESLDGGMIWLDVAPAEYRQGGTAQTESVDCGYVVPKKLTVIDSAGTESQYIDCDTSKTITKDEVTTSVSLVGITSITINTCVETIGNFCFDGKLYNPVNVSLPYGLLGIGYGAFRSCNGLTSISIPDSVTSISGEAFSYCFGLTSVTIGGGVTSISISAFTNCDSLTSITIDATTPPTLGYNAFYRSNNCPIYVPAESVNAYKTATGWSGYASRIQAIT